MDESEEEQNRRLEASKKILKEVRNILEDKDIMDELKKVELVEVDRYKLLQRLKICIENILIKHEGEKFRLIEIKDKRLIEELRGHESFQEEDSLINRSELDKIFAELKKEYYSIDIREIEKKRLEALLNKAGILREATKTAIQLYEEALSVSTSGYKMIHKRDIDEIFVNNYNPEWITNWNANMDLQLCLDYYAVISYISDYYSKDDSGTMSHIKDALKQAGNETLQTKLSLVIHQFLTHRQIGESEAFYRIMPHLHMKWSNIETIFVPTGFKKNRSKFLKKLTDEEANNCENIVSITDRDGLYTEKPSMMDKFERKDCAVNLNLNDVTYLQFNVKYTSCNKEPKEDDLRSEVFIRTKGNESLFRKAKEELELVITHDFDFEQKKQYHYLPKFIRLRNVRPGEPRYMRRRSRLVARLHKFNATKNPHEFYHSELQLYSTYQHENELEPENLDKCKILYDQISEHNGLSKIQNVKSVLMKHLESVEEGTERAKEMYDSKVGDTLDPTIEQENDDCEEEGVTEHPDFAFKDPTEFYEVKVETRKFKPIDLYDEQTMNNMTRKLDNDHQIQQKNG